MFDYKPLFKLLIEKEMSKTQLRDKTNMSTATLAKISKNKYVSMDTLDKICEVLNCEISEVIKHCKD